MAGKSRQQLIREEQIYQITSMVAGDFSLQEVLDKITEAAVEIVGVKACSIRLLDEDSGDLKMCSTFGLSAEYRDRGAVSKEDAVISAAFAGEAVVIDNMAADSRVRHKQAAVKEGLVSQLTVAMQFKGKSIGVLRLYSPKPKRFDENDITVSRLVATQCAVAITNARLYAEAIEGARMAEQMRLAGIIQRRMIPQKPPLIPGLDIAAVYRPCFDIGGDLYDFIQFDEHSVSVAVADVIGKGIPAAMMMSLLRGTIRAYADDKYSDHTMAEIIYRLNKAACRQCRDGEFITLFMANIDVEAMRLTYCNCGHEPAVLIRDGKLVDLDEGGLVLGVMEDAEYHTETIRLKNGDCLLFYTDGLIDAANFDGRLWGRDKMLDVAKEFVAGSAEQMVKNLLQYRRRFIGLAPQLDDTSIVIVKVDRTAKPFFIRKAVS